MLVVSDQPGIATDNMYVGLDQLGPDRVDAIINWGNNPSNQPRVLDRLRFVFTSSLVPGGVLNSGGPKGREIARMVSNGNNSATGFGGDINPAFNNSYSTKLNTVTPNSV